MHLISNIRKLDVSIDLLKSINFKLVLLELFL